ncbi:Malate synthase [Collichthys lucidus]|uniref:malate synthase n=1 Tax=Collichthys lucidus TaxID=240159 RepID=A0A4U5UD93_COLLU|nr:Malate synthase [Collichthys lucidus]
MELSPPPSGLTAEYETLFTTDSLLFLQNLISTFDEEVDEVLRLRISRKVHLDLSGDLPSFLESTEHIRRDPSWRVLPVPPRLQRRHVDIGDLAPCDTQRFIKALQSPAQGIQVDFDDGNCPTYHNQIKGIHNVLKAVHNQIPNVPHISQAPVLMLRPRAWNMVEHNMMATVLIENVLAAFEMEEILYELREHSAGLNCGIWDYSASFVNKFGHRQAFLLPDRSKYVNMEKRFLRSYMDLLVQTCHRRGALATGGMAALLLPHDPLSDSHRRVLATVTRLKLLEIEAGVDGFMVYDLNLIEPMQKLFKFHTEDDNQLQQLRNDVTVTPDDLLSMPSGGVTLYGLKYNIAVGVLFINAWLSGNGHFFYRGQVEDSATAEISRSQVWQWIRHQTQLEDDSRVVNRRLVTNLTANVMMELCTVCGSVRARQRLHTAADIFLEVVLRRDFPEFITTYLNMDHTFLSSQNSGQVEAPDVQRSKL